MTNLFRTDFRRDVVTLFKLFNKANQIVNTSSMILEELKVNMPIMRLFIDMAINLDLQKKC